MAIDRGTARRLSLGVAHGLAYEALLSLALLRGQIRAERLTEGDRLKKAYKSLPAPIRRAVEMVDAGFGFNWSDLVGLVRGAAPPRGVQEFVTHLSALDPLEVKLAMIGWHDLELRRRVGEDLFREAAVGVPAAVRRFRTGAVAAGRPRTGPLLGLKAEAAVSLTIEILQALPIELYRPDPVLGRLLADAASRVEALGRRLAPASVVERLTNGLVFGAEAGVEELVLVPTVCFRPWTVILDHERSKLFCFPVEPAPASADAPPYSLVALHRALGDETRLQLLKRLVAGRANFSTLSRDLGLARSTVHHHALILRSAGLVRLHLGADGGLELAPDLPEVGEPLRRYLGLPAGEATVHRK